MTKEQEEQEEQEGFRVTDKRSFQEDGETRTPNETAGAGEEPAGSPADDAPKSAPDQDAQEQPSIDFPSYLLSYYTQGLVLLGEVPNPYTNKKEEDTEAARHTIDILTLLQEKTKGNLSEDEQKLLDNVLYELRMKYMAKTNRIKI